MKFNGFKCDACGKFFEKNELKDERGITISGIGILNIQQGVTRHELCDDCTKKVLAILSGSADRGDISY